MEILKKTKGFYLTFREAQEACPAGGMIERGSRYSVSPTPEHRVSVLKGYYVYVPASVK